ncbi:MAG: VCBS repeat-containing protein [Opitutus sp.]|nr:VCBS repeat-containing protein [Opitutus sp.]
MLLSLRIRLAAVALLTAGAAFAEPAFTKLKLDSFFYAEGATIADFNRDGHPDVAAGPRIFGGPDFKTSKLYRENHAYDRLSYSHNFLTYTADFNADGWADILVIGWPGKEAFWYENPGADAKTAGEWKQHLAFASVDTESPALLDLTGHGRPAIIAATGGRLGWMEPDPRHSDAPWTFHALTPPGKWERYTHGVGLGDINGDGRPDFLEAKGWWEQPASLVGDPIWKFHPQSFGDGGAQMYAYDVNGDGRADVITSISAHGYGLSWFEQGVDRAGATTWSEHAITSRQPDEKLNGVQFSQGHALMLVDVDGDGLLDLVTGKRHWAHGNTGDPEPTAPAVLYWFRLARVPGGVTYTPHLIDDNSGVGCQFPVADLNGDGRPDFAIANKSGVFVFLQKQN